MCWSRTAGSDECSASAEIENVIGGSDVEEVEGDSSSAEDGVEI